MRSLRIWTAFRRTEMFDSETSELLSRAPHLHGLAGKDLGAELTRAYAWLAAFRLRTSGEQQAEAAREAIASGGSSGSSEWQREVSQLRRLCNTYEAIALLRTDGSEERTAAAFVAATANRLLHRAAMIGLFPTRPSGKITAQSIAPDISAMLLYFVAGYPSDAEEVAKTLTLPRGVEAARSLERALILFGRGAFADVRSPRTPSTQGFADALFPEDAATDALFERLEGVVYRLARTVSGQSDEGTGSLREELDAIEDLCVESASDDLQSVLSTLRPREATASAPSRTVISCFAGPYHIARLLRAATDTLVGMSVANLPTPDGTPEQVWAAYRQSVAKRRPFLWPNHRQAVDQGYLTGGVSSVITFPTGAGKSTLAELKIASALGAGKHVIYLAPTHALAGQVTRDLEGALKEAFPQVRVVQSLAAESEYAEVDAPQPADVAVMTPERCLTLLGVAPETFQSVGAVVFDECHLLHGAAQDDDKRGLDAMLCLLGLFDRADQADYVFLSAMVENATELAQWLQWATNRRCLPLALNWKPTRQARCCVLFREEDVERAEDVLAQARQVNRLRKTPYKAPPVGIQRILGALPFGLFGLSNNWAENLSDEDYSLLQLLDNPITLAGPKWSRLDSNADLVGAALARQLVLLKQRTILFVQQRRSCASAVARIDALLKGAGLAAPQLDDDEEALLSAAIEDAGSPAATLISAGTLTDQHHGLMLYAERRFAEKRFERPNGTGVLVATGTLAQGMNLPAEAVIIVGTKRYEAGNDDDVSDNGNWRQVGPEELLNAAGRAGRAGRAAAGLAFVVPEDIVTMDDDGHGNSGWRHIHSAFLSKSDQCLTVDDPLTGLLDRLQTRDGIPARNVRYFLNRLPLATGEDSPSASSARLLHKSLAQFRAIAAQEEAAFSEKLRLVPIAQRKLNAMLEERPELAWLDGAAWRLGVSVACLRSLHRRLEASALGTDATVLEWLSWLFSWLAEEPHTTAELIRPRSLKLALTPREQAKWNREQPASISPLLPAIEARVRAWMTGEPLLTIEQLLADAPVVGRVSRKRVGADKCENARKFVLRFMVDLSYAAGAVALVRREQLTAEADTDFLLVSNSKPPLPLAVLASCIREGADSPGVLAVRHVLGPSVSRLSINRRYRAILPQMEFANTSQSYPELRAQVALLLG